MNHQIKPKNDSNNIENDYQKINYHSIEPVSNRRSPSNLSIKRL